MINRKGDSKNLKATKFENINYYLNLLRNIFQFSCLLLISFTILWSTEPGINDKKDIYKQTPFNNPDSLFKFEDPFPLILRGTLTRRAKDIIKCFYDSTRTKAVLLVMDGMRYEDHKIIHANMEKFIEWGPYGPIKYKLLYARLGSYGFGIDILTIDIVMAKSGEAGYIKPSMQTDKTKTMLLYEKPITPKSGIFRSFSFESEKITDVFNYNAKWIFDVNSEEDHSFKVITDKTEYRIHEGKVIEQLEKSPPERITELPWWTKINFSLDGKKTFEVYYKDTEISLKIGYNIYESELSQLCQPKYKTSYSEAVEIEVLIKGPGFNKRIPFEKAGFKFDQSGENPNYIYPDFELKWSEDSKVILRYFYENRIDRLLETPKIDTFWAEDKKK